MLPKHEGKEAEMKKMAGKFIVFEGPDRAGKSTLARWLLGRMRKAGMHPFYAHSPATGAMGKQIYAMHHRLRGISPASRQALHVAAHLDAVPNQILPASRKGPVIIDRWWWSLAVYGKLAEVPAETMSALVAADRMAWNPIVPDALFLVGRGPETELSRGYLRHVHEVGAGAFYFIRNDGTLKKAQDQILQDLRARGWEL